MQRSGFEPKGTPAGGWAGAGRAQFGQAGSSAMSMKWSGLHDAAAEVAALAGIAPEPMDAETRAFPMIVRDAGGWRQQLAEQGVEDLGAIMEPGISALLAVHARGGDPSAAAMALWQEFQAARKALLALSPPPGARRSLRSA
ncbi:MAG: hypothetical protein AB7F98_07340 [Novosphingobium sp.]